MPVCKLINNKNPDTHTGKFEKATFAGGCFWCMEPPFEKLKGVKGVIPDYTGGHKENPTYEEVSSGRSGHIEAIQVIYDPSQTTYEELLDIFWRQIDPTDSNGQFADRGSQYRTAIFYHTDEQKRLAEKSKEDLQKSGRFSKLIVTEILKASAFYKAEEYHQDYHKKNPGQYKFSIRLHRNVVRKSLSKMNTGTIRERGYMWILYLVSHSSVL
jgi:peptide methionine sulfoxide reductase msrA/msrB